jgi:hypothetical protein
VSGHNSRVRTLQALIASMPVIAFSTAAPAVHSELGEIVKSRRVRAGNRRRILQVLHATRALDTALKQFVRHHGCTDRLGKAPMSLGGYLSALEQHRVTAIGTLPASQRKHFQRVIADPRNRYMHEAGASPVSDTELAVLLSEIDACLAAVAAL